MRVAVQRDRDVVAGTGQLQVSLAQLTLRSQQRVFELAPCRQLQSALPLPTQSLTLTNSSLCMSIERAAVRLRLICLTGAPAGYLL